MSIRSQLLSVRERFPAFAETPRFVTLGFITTFTVLVSTAEVFLFFDQLEPAMWLHFLTLVLCVVLPLKFSGRTNLFKAFVLLPVFRLVSLGMPIFFNTTILLFPLIYAPLIPACLLIARDLDVSITTGWQYGILLLPLALPMSVLLSALEFSIITPNPLVSTDSAFEIALLVLVMLLFVGFVEELLYRAILQRTLTEYIGFIPALLVANALFGLMHSGYGEPLEIVFAGTIGLLYGIVYRYTDSLLYITLLHGLLNTLLFGMYPLNGAVFGLPVGAESVSVLP